ncbi:MAG: hypothetical protein WC648_05210 [Candidatus Paceibacterota bacterium]|jgi:hypothetical protein
MKQYIDVNFPRPEDEAIPMARFDVTDYIQADIDAVITNLKVIYETEIPYRIINHNCGHDEGKSCDISLIEEVV